MMQFPSYTSLGKGKGSAAAKRNSAEGNAIDAHYDSFFAQECPTSVKLVKRLKEHQPDHDALFMNVGAALAKLSREELGLEERVAA